MTPSRAASVAKPHHNGTVVQNEREPPKPRSSPTSRSSTEAMTRPSRARDARSRGARVFVGPTAVAPGNSGTKSTGPVGCGAGGEGGGGSGAEIGVGPASASSREGSTWVAVAAGCATGIFWVVGGLGRWGGDGWVTPVLLARSTSPPAGPVPARNANRGTVGSPGRGGGGSGASLLSASGCSV